MFAPDQIVLIPSYPNKLQANIIHPNPFVGDIPSFLALSHPENSEKTGAIF